VAFGFTGLDDRDLVVDDRAFLADPASLWRAFARPYMQVVDAAHSYYRPLVTASYIVDAQWGLARPVAYHATNVLLFAAASALFARLLGEIGLGRGVTLAAGLAFAAHPALVPAVAWIPGRNDALLAVFALASWLAFVRARRREATAAAGPVRGAKLARGAHFALFGLALLTKETAVALPLVCVLHLALLEPEAWARFRRPAPLATHAGTWCALVLARFAAGALASGTAAVPSLSGLGGLPARFVSTLTICLGEILFPVRPAVLAAAADAPVWPGLVAGAALLAATLVVPRVRRRVVALGAGTFALFLAPAAAVPGTLLADHRLVLPACGVLLAAAEILRAIASPRPLPGEQPPALDGHLAGAFAAVTLAALAALTFAYEAAFRDPRAFAREAVEASPRSPLAHLCLGQSYQRDGDNERALAEYRVALSLGPAEVAHNNIAVIHMAHGAWPDAERELAAEIAINPRYGKAYGNLGIVLRHEGRRSDACAAADRAVALAPDDARWREERAADCGH
jgi:tetratricopeptide (TPR) repeat protein